MAFGLLAAPYWFQYIMDVLLGNVERAAAFVDDLTARGYTWRDVWDWTLVILEIVTKAGFMVNLSKCKFCVPKTVLLGHEVCATSYRLSQKFLARQLQAKIPRTFQSLQALLGGLLWASPFLPGYKKLVRPIEALLGAKGEAVWSRECTSNLNKLLDLMWEHFALRMVDFSQPLVMTVSYEDAVGSAVLLQKQHNGEEAPVAMVGKRFTPAQEKASPLEKLIMVGSWAVRKLKRYTAFAPETVLLLPSHAEYLALTTKDFNPRLAAMLLELQLYRVKF